MKEEIEDMFKGSKVKSDIQFDDETYEDSETKFGDKETYDDTDGFSISELKKLIRECISEVIDSNQLEERCKLMTGQDYTTINGMSYRLKECGCDTTMGYDNNKHTLMVRRDHLPLAIDTLKNTGDDLSLAVSEKLQKKYFPNADKGDEVVPGISKT